MQRLLPPAVDYDSVSNLEFLHESMSTAKADFGFNNRAV
jgi:hypothetical protein